jgi:putative hydrolase of the HAD superfamily
VTGDLRPLTALIVDYGGVLTTPVSDTVGTWLRAEGLDPRLFSVLMREWLSDDVATSPAHDLETGRLPLAEFEVVLARRLRRADGTMPEPEGLLARMFGGFRAAPGMYDVLRRARGHGLRTALLSNSWGADYDRDGWGDLFDAVVISGEVGLRKPDADIYLLTASRLGLRPEQCVFVDDLAVNVRGATRAGMAAVHHTALDATVAELATLFGHPL